MDRNQALGLLIISGLFLVYLVYFGNPPQKQKGSAPEPEKQSRQVASKDSVPDQTKDKGQASGRAQEQTATTNTQKPEADSAKKASLKEEYGAFASIARGTEKDVILKNKNLEVFLNTHGGKIKNVHLRNRKTFNGKPLFLLDSVNNTMNMRIPTTSGSLNLSELYFDEVIRNGGQSANDTSVVILRARLDSGKYIDQVYKLAPNSFQVKYNIRFHETGKLVLPRPVKFHWAMDMKKLERDMDNSRQSATINYYTCNKEFSYLSVASEERQTKKLNKGVKWIAMKQRFFNAGIIASNCFASAKLQSKTDPQDTSIVKRTQADITIPFNELSRNKRDFTYYFGPNNFQVTKKVTEDYEDNVDLGWAVFAWINRILVIPIFNFLDDYIDNYGIIILILVLIVKTLLFPLAYRSYLSMAKMRELKPELDEIKERVGDDMQKVQQEQMQLYQKVGINPLSGCIPVLLQLPILLALFNFFPNSVELRQEAFLWAKDLSTYDAPISLPFEIPVMGDHISLFTLLMTLSTLAYTYYNNQINTSAQGPMKSIGYIMPVIFMFVLNKFPAGLTYYYFVSNLITISQQLIATRFIDRDKIRKQMEENKVKNQNKKKGGFQARLEEAMKAQEEKKKGKKS